MSSCVAVSTGSPNEGRHPQSLVNGTSGGHETLHPSSEKKAGGPAPWRSPEPRSRVVNGHQQANGRLASPPRSAATSRTPQGKDAPEQEDVKPPSPSPPHSLPQATTSSAPDTNEPGSQTADPSLAKSEVKVKKAVDRFSLNPWEKFIRYRTVPCKFILNVIILGLLLGLVYGFQLQRATSDFQEKAALTRLFLPLEYTPEDSSLSMEGYLPTYKFLTLQSIQDFVVEFVDRYYSLSNTSLGLINYLAATPPPMASAGSNISSEWLAQQQATYAQLVPLNSTHKIAPPIMTATVRVENFRFSTPWQLGGGDQGRKELTFALTPDDPLGLLATGDGLRRRLAASSNPQIPNWLQNVTACQVRFEPVTLRPYSPCPSGRVPRQVDSMRDRLVSFTIVTKFRSILPVDLESEQPVEYIWKVTQNFDFSRTGLVILTVSVTGSMSQTEEPIFGVAAGLSIALIVFGSWDCALRIKTVIRFRRFKREHSYLFLSPEERAILREVAARRLAKKNRDQQRQNGTRGEASTGVDIENRLDRGLLLSNGSYDAAAADEVARGGTRSPEVKNGNGCNGSMSVGVGSSTRAQEGIDDEAEEMLTLIQLSVAQDLKNSSKKKGVGGLAAQQQSFSGGVTKGFLGVAVAGDVATAFSEQKLADAENENEDEAALVAQGLALDQVAADRINKHTMGGKWIVWSLIDDFLIIVSAIMNLLEIYSTNQTLTFTTSRNVLLGLCCLMSTVLFISYFRHVPKFYFLVEAMWRSLPRLGIFAFGVLPLFFGYAVFGVVVFAPLTPLFSTFEFSATTLLCCMFGDTLLAAATATQSYYLGIGRIYLFSFVILLFVGGLNIALSITLDSYYVIKHKFKLFRFEDEVDPELSNSETKTEFREVGPEDSSRAPLPIIRRGFRNAARTQGGPVLSPEDYGRAMEGLFALLECLPDDGDDVSPSRAISVEDIAEMNSMMTTS